jgi:hypothetical protein
MLTFDGKETSGGTHDGGQVRRRRAAKLDEDDDMLSAMARELVGRNGIGETADAIWKALNAENQKLFPTATGSNADIPAANSPDILTESRFDPACLVESALENKSIVAFGQRTESLSGRRRRARAAIPEQNLSFAHPDGVGTVTSPGAGAIKATVDAIKKDAIAAGFSQIRYTALRIGGANAPRLIDNTITLR